MPKKGVKMTAEQLASRAATRARNKELGITKRNPTKKKRSHKKLPGRIIALDSIPPPLLPVPVRKKKSYYVRKTVPVFATTSDARMQLALALVALIKQLLETK